MFCILMSIKSLSFSSTLVSPETQKPSNSYFQFLSICQTHILKKISDSENSSPGDKFHFILEASRRSNATCLQLFAKDIESCTGELAASSIVSRCLNDPGNISPSLCDEKVLCWLWIFFIVIGRAGMDNTDEEYSFQFQELVRRLCVWRDLMVSSINCLYS